MDNDKNKHSEKLEWITDKKMYDKGVELKDAFVRILDHEDSSPLRVFDLNFRPPRFNQAMNLLWDHRKFVNFDNEELMRADASINTVARQIFASNSDISELTKVQSGLGHWKGKSAEGFGGYVEKMKQFFPAHAVDFQYAGHVVAALQSAAMAARENYVQLTEATKAAVDKALGDSIERETEFKIAVIADFAVAALAIERAAVKELTKEAVSTAVEVTKDASAVIIEGDSFDDLMSGYHAGINKIATSYRNSLYVIADKLRNYVSAVEAAPPVFLSESPSDAPPIDIRKPGFKYEMFRSDLRTSSSYEAGVNKEATKRSQQPGDSNDHNPDSEIGRRLSGGQ